MNAEYLTGLLNLRTRQTGSTFAELNLARLHAVRQPDKTIIFLVANQQFARYLKTSAAFTASKNLIIKSVHEFSYLDTAGRDCIVFLDHNVLEQALDWAIKQIKGENK